MMVASGVEALVCVHALLVTTGVGLELPAVLAPVVEPPPPPPPHAATNRHTRVLLKKVNGRLRMGDGIRPNVVRYSPPLLSPIRVNLCSKRNKACGVGEGLCQ